MQDEPQWYSIRLTGHLNPQWATYFEGFVLINDEQGDVVLSGIVADQAALHGVLRKVRNLALTLVSVIRVDREQPEVSHVDADADSTGSTKEVDA